MPTNLSPATVFNPGLATVPLEDMTRLSRPSEAPRLTSVAGEAVKDAGNVFVDAVKVAHTLTEQDLGERIRNSAENQRDPYNDQLAAALDEARGQVKRDGGTVTRVDTQGNPIGPRGSLDILGQAENTKTPLELQNLTENLTSLSGAKANGKLSRTGYLARLDSLAKDFRADFPGWRDFIDKKFEQVTGVIPANALVQARISDINSFVGAAKAERDKIVNVGLKAIQEGMPSSEKELALYKATGNERAFLQYIQQQNAQEWATKQMELKLKEQTAFLGEKKTQATMLVNQHAANVVGSDLNVIYKAVGINVDPKNPSKAFEDMSPAQAEQVGQMILAHIPKWEADIRTRAFRPMEGTKESWGTYATAEEVNKAIDANTRIGKDMAAYLMNKETGLAGKLARITKAWHEEGENAITGTPELKDIMIMSKTMLNNFGPQAMPTIMDNVIREDLPGKVKNYMSGKVIEAAAGKPNPVTGIPINLEDDVLKYRERVLAIPNVPDADKQKWIAAGTQQLLKQIYSIPDPTIPKELKQRYIERAFSPEGQDLIGQMNRDGIGTNGAKGKFDVYNHLYSPEMTAAIKEVGGKHWDMYKDKAAGVWARELLKPELREIDSIVRNNPDLKLGWDNVNYKFQASFAGDVSRFTSERVGDAVQKLNSTLAKYAAIAKADGKDVNAYVGSVLYQAVGQNPKENVTADQFLRSVIATSPQNIAVQKEREASRQRVEQSAAAEREAAGAAEKKFVAGVKDLALPKPIEPQYDENRTNPPRKLRESVNMPAPPNAELIPPVGSEEVPARASGTTLGQRVPKRARPYVPGVE